MRTLVIIQARIGGTRLPGKIGKRIGEWTVLEHVVKRARYHGFATCIAAPVGSASGLAEPWAVNFRQSVSNKQGRGAFVPIYYPDCDEDDVMTRFAMTARWAQQMASFAGHRPFGCYVRLTADCPFVPVAAIDAVATSVTNSDSDYVETRSDPSTRPNGIDAQAFTPEVLAKASLYDNDREHLTNALKAAASNPRRMSKLEGLSLDMLPPFRITLDTPEDYERLCRLAEHIGVDPSAGRPSLRELAKLHSEKPELFGTMETVA